MQTTEYPTNTEPGAEQAPSQRAATPPPTMWAVVELMGHSRIAGAISQQSFGGQQFVQVDVPAVTVTDHEWSDQDQRIATQRTIPAHSRSFGASAIYSINWCDQLAATVAAHSIKHELIKPYSLQAALADLPAPERHRLLALTAVASAVTDTTADGDDDGHF